MIIDDLKEDPSPLRRDQASQAEDLTLSNWGRQALHT